MHSGDTKKQSPSKLKSRVYIFTAKKYLASGLDVESPPRTPDGHIFGGPERTDENWDAH